MRKLSELFFQPGRTYFRRVDMLLEHVIRSQSSIAARNLYPVPFFRFLRDESGYNDTFRESQIGTRVYTNPVQALLYVAHGQQQKPLEKYGVDIRLEHEVSVDLAECIRLGEVYNTEDEKFDFKFYLPKANDMFQWNESLFIIQEMKPEHFYVPVQKYVVWKGNSTIFRSDSTSPTVPIVPLDKLPPLEHPLWVR